MDGGFRGMVNFSIGHDGILPLTPTKTLCVDRVNAYLSGSSSICAIIPVSLCAHNVVFAC